MDGSEAYRKAVAEGEYHRMIQATLLNLYGPPIDSQESC
jgi:hypothetical protein